MTTYALYDGKVEIIYEQRGRKKGYWLGDEKLLRVTEVAPPVPFTAGAYYGAKLAAEAWEKLCAETPDYEGDWKEVMRKAPSDTTARDQGTELHALIESWFEGQQPFVPEPLEAKWKQFQKWIKRHEYVVWATEKKVFSKLYRYAGTCDWVGEFDNWPTMIDWKGVTGTKKDTKARSSYPIQTSAYVQAYTEELGHDAPQSFRRMTVCIADDGVKVFKYDDFDGDFGAFLNLLRYYRWEKKMEPL